MFPDQQSYEAFDNVHPRWMQKPGYSWSQHGTPPAMPRSVSTPWLSLIDPVQYSWQMELHGAAATCLVLAASYRQPENLFDKPKFARFYATFRVVLWEAVMAKPLSTKSNRSTPEWQGFLERRLSDLELEECDGWKPKPNEIWELVDALTQNEYKVQLTYSSKTGLATCTLTDQKPGRSTAGWAVSTQEENCALALKAALFKHYTVLKSDWAQLLGAPQKGKRG